MARPDKALDNADRHLLNLLQTAFPLAPRPFKALGEKLGLSEEETIRRVRGLKELGIVRDIGAIFDSRRLGYQSSLVGMKVDAARLDEAAEVVNSHPGVSHNYARDHDYNLWFTIAAPPARNLQEEVRKLHQHAKPRKTRLLPMLKLFKIGVVLDMTGEQESTAREKAGKTEQPEVAALTPEQIRTIRELQEDLPVECRPFLGMAHRLGISEEELLRRAHDFIRTGTMRRFAAVLHHREAGFVANAMAVWAVPPERLDEAGATMASFRAVSHCCQRPTYEDWPYCLFAMIHARTREECQRIAEEISKQTGLSDYSLLFSTKEYKKVRVRHFAEDY
jgi:DNA-binding Lrp family transcriptional regulator